MAKKKQIKKPLLKKQIKTTHKKAVLAMVPKKENQYKPPLIRRYGLILVLILAIFMQFSYNFTKTGSVLGKVVNITPNGLLAATNDERDNGGVQRLKLNEQLNRAAAAKVQDIFDKQYWDHTAPDGTTPWYWINMSNYKYEEAGENLAKNFSTANGTVAGWMASDSHRNNMLKPNYTEAGFAVASGELDGEEATVVVALYAKPASQSLVVGGSPFVASAVSESSTEDNQPLSIATRMGIAIQSLTPAAMTSVVLLFIAATIATTSHTLRKTLPKKYRKKWYKEHGAAKASILIMVAGLIILLYGGGSL